MASPQNANMFQFSTRETDDDEELSMVNIGGINIWMDQNRVPVIVDLPNDFTRMDYVRSGGD